VTNQTIELFDNKGNHRAKVTAVSEHDEIKFSVEGEAPGLKFEVVV
jgi:hypothetical protein